MWLIFITILVIIIILISRWYIKHCKIVKCLEKIPGPPPLPFVGNALDLGSTKVLLPRFMEYHEKYGNVVKLHVGPTPLMLLISDYNLIEYILSSTHIVKKAQQYEFFSNWLGQGLIVADGGSSRWKKHRKILTYAFHFQILEQFVPVFEANTNILVEKLKGEVGKTSFNIHSYLKLCSLDIICETAMGTYVNAQNNSESEYVRSVKTVCEIILERCFSPLLQHNIFYSFSKQYQMEKKAVKILHDYTNSIIKKKKTELEDKGEVINDKGFVRKRKLALLDLLLQENAKSYLLSDQDIREEVDNFMFAGHDTTASAVSFALYCLADNPEVQERVVEELQEIFHEDKFRSVTLRDLQSMKYLELVIKETLRLYPSAPFYSRNTPEDIEYDGQILPKGLTLVIHVCGIHYNPEFYPEPTKFIPERFSTENLTGRHPFAYIPFSAGPRNCIGQRYAMLEMKTILCILLKNFKILPVVPKHHLILTPETVLVSSNGICIRLEKRNF